MFKNFKFNLNVIINLLIANIFIIITTLICIQYGISFIDKIVLYISTSCSIVFMVKAFTSGGRGGI